MSTNRNETADKLETIRGFITDLPSHMAEVARSRDQRMLTSLSLIDRIIVLCDDHLTQIPLDSDANATPLSFTVQAQLHGWCEQACRGDDRPVRSLEECFADNPASLDAAECIIRFLVAELTRRLVECTRIPAELIRSTIDQRLSNWLTGDDSPKARVLANHVVVCWLSVTIWSTTRQSGAAPNDAKGSKLKSHSSDLMLRSKC